MGNEYECEKGKHDFTDLPRMLGIAAGGHVEPARLYCRNCARVRDLPVVEWYQVVEKPATEPA